jgi:hypothetical protein
MKVTQYHFRVDLGPYPMIEALMVRRFRVIREQCRFFEDTDLISTEPAPNTHCRSNKKAYALIASIMPATPNRDINRLKL